MYININTSRQKSATARHILELQPFLLRGAMRSRLHADKISITQRAKYALRTMWILPFTIRLAKVVEKREEAEEVVEAKPSPTGGNHYERIWGRKACPVPA